MYRINVLFFLEYTYTIVYINFRNHIRAVAKSRFRVDQSLYGVALLCGYMRFHLYFFYIKYSLSLSGAYVVIECYSDHCILLLSFVSRVGIGFFLLAVVILTNQLGAEEDADGERHDQQNGQDGDHRDEAHVTQAVTHRNILSAGRGICEHMDMETSNNIYKFYTHIRITYRSKYREGGDCQDIEDRVLFV